MAERSQGRAIARQLPRAGLLRSALLRRALAEFHHFTGVSAKLIPARVPSRPIRFGDRENDFCRTMLTAGVCGRACLQTQTRLLRRVEHKLKPQQVRCLGGILHLAVPLLVRGRHVATILGGRVRVSASDAPAAVVARLIAGRARPAAAPELRALYERTPILNPEQARTAVRLLDVLARFFELVLAQQPALPKGEPPRLTQIRAFVQQHLSDHLTTREAAAALALSEGYFCRLFQRLTGLTFHAYVARLRTEAARSALAQSGRRISEVAMATGFQSVSDFNRVFKAHTGLTPSAYRARLRSR
jgi:AraC-like DNA-binding protein/ligand-binding sensor protein